MNDKQYSILIADDDEDDFILIVEALKNSGNQGSVDWVKDGEELIDYLHTRYDSKNKDKQIPQIIVLDLNMPKKGGWEALENIKSDSKFKNIPIIILSTSRSKSDIKQAYELGANSFIQKPFKYSEFKTKMENFFRYWILTVKLPT